MLERVKNVCSVRKMNDKNGSLSSVLLLPFSSTVELVSLAVLCPNELAEGKTETTKSKKLRNRSDRPHTTHPEPAIWGGCGNLLAYT